MGLSSNTLFHFTKEIEILKKILTEGFKISYCLEEENAFPMISFCDLPLSSIREQIDKYGNYAIGLTMDWGNSKKLNPVFYFQENSELIDSYKLAHLWSQNQMKKVINGEVNPNLINEMKPYIQYMFDSSRFQKFYSNDLVRDGEIHKNYKFYDEREWRYVPNINETFLKPRLSKSDFIQYKKNNTKPHIKDEKYSLKFTAKDIRYIIVNSENEILPLISFLKEQNHLFVSENEIELLKTKITTSKKIKEDN